MRAIKSTSLSFGLVNVPVKMYKATEDHDVKLHQFHDGCGGGVTYAKVCKACNAGLETADIVKGVIRDDKTILVTEDDLTNLEVETGPEISVVQFVNIDEINPIYFESHYFLAAAAVSDLEGYATIRKVMSDKKRGAIVRFVMRRSGGVGKEHLGLLAPYGDNAMIVHTLAWADEVRQPAFSLLDTPVKLNPAVVKVAADLVDAMTSPFDPQSFTDNYTEQVSALIDSKASGKTRAVKARVETSDVVSNDLLAKLSASAAAKKKTPTKAAAKPAAKKAPAKKAAPRRRTAVA